MQITTTFANDLGRDADSTTIVVTVTSDTVSLNYASTRGIYIRRDVRIADRQAATAVPPSRCRSAKMRLAKKLCTSPLMTTGFFARSLAIRSTTCWRVARKPPQLSVES
jgi:hypothetical protein